MRPRGRGHNDVLAAVRAHTHRPSADEMEKASRVSSPHADTVGKGRLASPGIAWHAAEWSRPVRNHPAGLGNAALCRRGYLRGYLRGLACHSVRPFRAGS